MLQRILTAGRRSAFNTFLAVVFAAACVSSSRGGEPARKTENVIVVTLDGYRWQDFFTGADDSLLNKEFGGAKEPDKLKTKYWRETASERRLEILPFIWGKIAKDGQIFGDATRKAPTRITNGHNFSYPGYSELFCGFADPRIDSNSKKDNPNATVLEFFNEKPAYKGRVAAVGSWDVFPYIFRARQNGLKVHAGLAPIDDAPLTERQRSINETLNLLPRYWPDCAFDATTMQTAEEHLRRHKPRVFYVSLGETDEWGHGRRYDLYLDAAQKSDRFIADLWIWLQQTPQYKDKTALIVTTDHGRGPTRADWIDHGKKVPTAEFIWIAVLGPDTPALGIRENIETTQSQVAVTIADFLGEDLRAASPQAAKALPAVRRTKK